MGAQGVDQCYQKDDDDDDHCEEDIKECGRPLKKARYAWQVKGKYHLKGDAENGDKDSPSSSVVQHGNESCNPRCCVANFFSTDNIASEESSDDENVLNSVNNSKFSEVPVTLVKPIPKNDDYYLNKWQARQIARCYLDNSVNEVLEKWVPDTPMDVANFINDCDSDGQVEDEGILMAIQSHGLQSSNHSTTSLCDTTVGNSHRIEDFAIDNIQNAHNERLKRKTLEERCILEDNIELRNHKNFLDAAVSVAIQKKGLSSQNFV